MNSDWKYFALVGYYGANKGFIVRNSNSANPSMLKALTASATTFSNTLRWFCTFSASGCVGLLTSHTSRCG